MYGIVNGHGQIQELANKLLEFCAVKSDKIYNTIQDTNKDLQTDLKTKSPVYSGRFRDSWNVDITKNYYNGIQQETEIEVSNTARNPLAIGSADRYSDRLLSWAEGRGRLNYVKIPSLHDYEYASIIEYGGFNKYARKPTPAHNILGSTMKSYKDVYDKSIEDAIDGAIQETIGV